MGNCPGILNFFPRKGEAKILQLVSLRKQKMERGNHRLPCQQLVGRKSALRNSRLSLQTWRKASVQGPRPDWAKCYPASSCPRFPCCQKTRQKTDTRQSLALLQVARCFNRGRWFAYELGALLEKDRTIPTGKQGCFQKLKPWLTDEGVELVLQDCGYDFEALKVTVSETLASVTEAFIRGFYKLALYV
ncbi:hypothetical protein V8E54_014285, partial [Elaphomyces granulatus]